MSEADDLRAEIARLEDELRQVTAGSAWKNTIAKFLFQAEVDDELQDYIDDQLRKRMEDLVRTEEKWCEVSQVLWDAKLRLRVRDGKIFIGDETEGGQEWSLQELLPARASV